MVVIKLQNFADSDKTEKATPKRKQDARKRGQVLQSREISSALLLIILFSVLSAFGGYIYTEISRFFNRVFTIYSTVDYILNTNYYAELFSDAALLIFKTAGLIMAVAMVAGLAVNYAQVGFILTFDTLGMKFDRVNPLKGLKRLFSIHSSVELLKSTIKIMVAGYIGYNYISSEARSFLSLMELNAMETMAYIGTISVNTAVRICMALLVLGILDFIYKWWEHEKSLKMTKQEVKEENKQMEGNPEIKSRIRQKQRQISMRRMMSEVPKADVVITNPTHYAVAVKYDAAVSNAPVILAKGQDYIALKIKETAAKNKVEIVENKPLAKALYNTVDIGEAIPPELYQAVAEVLAFVYNLKSKDSRKGDY